MMHEDVAQDGQLRVQWRHFTKFRLERCAEASQRGGGVELGDLELDLLGEEFAFEVCERETVSQSVSLHGWEKGARQ